MGKILLSNVAGELATRSGISREAASTFMHAFIEVIEKGLQTDNIVKVKGLGTFKLQEVNDRDSVDVNTGERITIKGYRKVTFTPDSAMKEFVNRPFAHFEPTELNEGFPADADALDVSLLADEAEEADSMDEATPAVEPAPAAVVEEPVAEPSEEPIAEEPAEVVEEIVPEAPVEAPVVVPVEEPVEAPAEELVGEPADVPSEELVEAPAEEVTESVAEQPQEKVAKPEAKKRRGCGCMSTMLVLILLLLAAVAVGYYLWVTPLDELSFLSSTEVEADNNDIVVKTDLEDELGIAWNKTSESAPPAVDEDVATVEEVAPAVEEATPVIEEEVVPVVEDSVPADNSQQPTAKSQEPTANSQALVIVESLGAKSIKDITVADTTDYTIAGTLVAHKLKSGETIIQLSNKYYGDKRLWPYIVHHNQMKQYNSLAIGQMINIPVLKERQSE